MLRHLPQLFRSPFLRKVATLRYYPELAERLHSGNLGHLLNLPLRCIFDSVYEVLHKSYRCEYVFKNLLAHGFLAQSGHQTESYITDEFRVGKSRVDMAVFADTSVAYEIKTEYDSSFRLPSQTAEYAKLFDRVYVVTTHKLLGKIESAIPKTVGILILLDAGEFEFFRESASHANLTSLCIAFDCLRQEERLAIVEGISGSPTDFPSSTRYTECKNHFRKLLPFEAQGHLVRHIRARGSSLASKTLVAEVPKSLKHSALTLRASRKEMETIRMELQNIPQQPKTKPSRSHAYILPVSQRKTTRADRIERATPSVVDG